MGILERYEIFLDMENSTKVEANEELKKRVLYFSREIILKAGYYFSIFAKFLGFVQNVHSILKETSISDKHSNKDFENSITSLSSVRNFFIKTHSKFLIFII